MSFDPKQLTSWGEATRIAARISNSVTFRKAGIRVRPQGPPNSGIYQPYWIVVPGSPIPSLPGQYFLHFRFTNGMEGMNAGLVREKFNAYPTSPLYVLEDLLHEVQAGAPTALRIAA